MSGPDIPSHELFTPFSPRRASGLEQPAEHLRTFARFSYFALPASGSPIKSQDTAVDDESAREHKPTVEQKEKKERKAKKEKKKKRALLRRQKSPVLEPIAEEFEQTESDYDYDTDDASVVLPFVQEEDPPVAAVRPPTRAVLRRRKQVGATRLLPSKNRKKKPVHQQTLLSGENKEKFNWFVSVVHELVGFTGCEKQLTAVARTLPWLAATEYSRSVALMDLLTMKTFTQIELDAVAQRYCALFEDAEKSETTTGEAGFLAVALTANAKSAVADVWEYVREDFEAGGVALGPWQALNLHGTIGTLFRKLCGLKYRKYKITILGVPGQKFQMQVLNSEWICVVDKLIEHMYVIKTPSE